jgi:2-iminobutanoate/2-iminopropanoate deaminase
MTTNRPHINLNLAPQRAALENMKKLLEGAGSGLEHVVKVNVYLAHLVRDFAAMNEVYE